jgi:hypothetical protein
LSARIHCSDNPESQEHSEVTSITRAELKRGEREDGVSDSDFDKAVKISYTKTRTSD